MGYSIQSQGAIPKYASANPNYGVLAPKPSGTVSAFTNQPLLNGKPSPTNNGTPTAAGNSSLQGKDYYQNLVDNGTPLEKQAGLIGLKNPATGTNPGMLPTTPVKKITATDGTTTEFHAPSTGATPPPSFTPTAGASAAGAGTGSAIPTSPKPDPTNFQSNLQTTANSGGQTANEASTQQGLLSAGQGSPAQAAALNAVQYGLGVQNNNNFGQYADAGLLGEDPQAYVNEANAPDLAGRASATRGLAGQYANLYGTQANAALNEANTIQGQGITAAQGAYTGAQNQAGRATGANESVQGATAPIPNTPYGLNPATGTYTGSGLPNSTSATDAVLNAGKLAGLQNQASTQTGAYQTGLNSLKYADTLQPQILSTLAANPSLNNTPVSAITNLNQLLSGEISSGPQQQLSQQINSYIQALGIDPATATNIASQSQGTIAQLLDSLRATAQAKTDAQNPNNISGGSGSSNSGSYTSSTGNTYNLPY